MHSMSLTYYNVDFKMNIHVLYVTIFLKSISLPCRRLQGCVCVCVRGGGSISTEIQRDSPWRLGEHVYSMALDFYI